MAAYWLLGLAPVAAIGYIFWAYGRKSAAQATARERRLAQLLTGSTAPQPAGILPAGTRPAGMQPAVPVARDDAVALPYVAKPRFLTPPHAVLYYLLKGALPEYEVFAHVSLASVIEVAPPVSGAERDDRRRAISQLAIDCVVCTKGFAVMAAIDLATANVSDSSLKSECLKAAGVRYVRFDPLRLPQRQHVRALVLGATG